MDIQAELIGAPIPHPCSARRCNPSPITDYAMHYEPADGEGRFLLFSPTLDSEAQSEQMQIFAEEVMPVIARECGGKVELPKRGLALVA